MRSIIHDHFTEHTYSALTSVSDIAFGSVMNLLPYLNFLKAHRMSAAHTGVLLAWVIFFSSWGQTQSLFDMRGSTQSTGLAYATTARIGLTGVHVNPASWAGLDARAASVYAGQMYGLPELRHGALSMHWPRWGYAFSAGSSTFGFEDYRETHLSIGVARALRLGTARMLHLGITTRYYHVGVSRFGSAQTVGVHLGAIMQVLPLIHVGAHATNINQPAWAPDTPLPRTLSLGAAYDVSEHVDLSADLFKDLDFPLRFRSGIEATVLPMLVLRGGLQTAPSEFALGLELQRGALHLGVAAEQHWELGWSPAADVRVLW